MYNGLPKGREHNPPPRSRHLGQVVSGCECVTLWRKTCLTPPPSPTLLASWEIADRHPNQTICPTRDCCHVLTEIAGQPGTDFSHRGERSTLYTVYNTLYKQLAGSFWVLRRNLQQVAPNQQKPHTTPLHSLIYSIYISVGLPPLTYCLTQPLLLIRSLQSWMGSWRMA
jgi:hypothetical protein